MSEFMESGPFTTNQGYTRFMSINMPPFGWPTKEQINSLPQRYIDRLMTMAFAIACMHGNSFEPSIPYYMAEAYAIVWWNGLKFWINGENRDPLEFPNLYPATAAECHHALIEEGNEFFDYYETFSEDQRPNKEKRAKIRNSFISGWIENSQWQDQELRRRYRPGS